jgi:hypothetical protein
MDRKTQKLLTKVEKAGVRQSLKAGHVLDQQELLSIKVQLIPAPVRILTGVLALAAGTGSWMWSDEHPFGSIMLFLLAVLLLVFTIYGVRRTLSKIVDSWDAGSVADLLSSAVEGITEGAGSLFDGF